MARGLPHTGMHCLAERDRLLGLERSHSSTIKGMAASKVAIKTDKEIFERQARICKAFAHPGRLQILDLLGHGERGVSELQEALGISKTRMSQHVSILKSAGVLATRREGKQIYCSLAMPEVKQACQLIRKVLQAQIAASHRLVA
jgi:DNA-binding transcriptional ArsR family regulator